MAELRAETRASELQSHSQVYYQILHFWARLFFPSHLLPGPFTHTLCCCQWVSLFQTVGFCTYCNLCSSRPWAPLRQPLYPTHIFIIPRIQPSAGEIVLQLFFCWFIGWTCKGRQGKQNFSHKKTESKGLEEITEKNLSRYTKTSNIILGFNILFLPQT